MKKIEFAQTLGILSALGVVFGILLLVFELSLNRQMMQAQTRTALTQSLMEMSYELTSDDRIADIQYRGNAGESLTGYERLRYMTLANAQFRYQENVHYQYRIGLYDETEFAAQRNTWKDTVFVNKGLVDAWCSTRATYSPEYEAEINGLLTVYKCE